MTRRRRRRQEYRERRAAKRAGKLEMRRNRPTFGAGRVLLDGVDIGSAVIDAPAIAREEAGR